MIECHPRYCPLGQYCTNQRFQKRTYPKMHRVKVCVFVSALCAKSV